LHYAAIFITKARKYKNTKNIISCFRDQLSFLASGKSQVDGSVGQEVHPQLHWSFFVYFL